MKKIKLMLVAFCAMLSTTVFGAGEEFATTTFRYQVLTDATEAAAGTALIQGFVADYPTASMATVTIPAQLSHPTNAKLKYKVTQIDGSAFTKNANITKVVIESGDLASLSTAFSGCSKLAEVDFTKATGLASIDAGAFEGTIIKELDFSKTKLGTVNPLFGTHFKYMGTFTAAEAQAYNNKLENAVSTSTVKTAATYYADDTEAAAANAANQMGDYDADAKTYFLGADGVEDIPNKAIKASTYNSKVTGASVEEGDLVSAARIAAYNEAVEVEAGDVKTPAVYYTQAEADAYNNALAGAKSAGDDKGEVPAVAYATLTKVTLPETWTSIADYAFLNCTGLATITLTAAKAGITTQAIGTEAFLGTALTALDFTGTKVSGVLSANLLVDGTNVKKNTTLKTVTLTKDITGLNKNFAFCTALEAIDLTNIPYASFAAGEFEGSGLKSITIPATYTTIPANAFKDCTALAKVEFAPVKESETWTFTEIGEYAFANTALVSFTVPNVLPYATLLVGPSPRVADNAFADCAKLKSFTYKPKDVEKENVKKVISDNVFLGCEDGITFYTLAGYAEATAVGKTNAPKHSTFSYDASGDPTEVTELTAKIFKNGNKKYFLKYNHSLLVTEESPSLKNIKIAKANAKVYAAYNADDDHTIVMQQFKTKDGYYHIAAGDNVMIISDTEKIPYELSTTNGSNDANADGIIAGAEAGQGSSWLLNASATFVDRQSQNMLQYVSDEAGVKRSVLEAQLPEGYSIFAWSNTTSATGWLKITSGSTFPQKTMYIFAKPTETAEGVRVIWLDENGNIEDEATAIQSISIKSENENGAIYNVAGQRVNASYKGVVIKDGKKYMQK